MHFYTSVNMNYLAKARVLAASVKRHNPDAYFSLLLYDDVPADFDLAKEPFDEVVTVYDLDLPVKNLEQWMYIHNTVELGTAIKGQALVDFLKRSPKVAYIDPDIVVYDNLKELEDLLDTYGCVLTPHQLAPDKTEIGIEGNEMGSMLRGTYNFGFYAANNSVNGMKFATWFRDRLLTHCYDDVPNGLFTDQRWGNLAPAMFDDVCIWRHPGCNVSTWNISNREITKTPEGKYLVNGKPLLFYHFSGFDSGAQLEMLHLFGNGNPNLFEMREWYVKAQDEAGQQACKKFKSKFNYYTDGTLIQTEERLRLRHDKWLQETFSKNNPYDKQDGNPSYYEWYQAEKAEKEASQEKTLEDEVKELRTALDGMRNSTSWKVTKPLRGVMRLFRK